MKNLFLILFSLPLLCLAQKYTLTPLTTGTNTSLRGLSVVSDDIAWVSGSNGYVGKTTDGGSTWTWVQPTGYQQLDFRSIKAFNANKAIIANAGSPAHILLTEDGGQNWKQVYNNIDSAIFLDGVDFWNNDKGIIFGDPIKNKMQLLKTVDGGLTWQDISKNLKANLAPGEAGFAASGTAINTFGSKVWIATGGLVSNIYYSANYGKTWQVYKCPIIQGENSMGAFSINFLNAKKGVVVGGNYLKDKDNTNNIFLTNNGGKTWQKPVKSVFGFRSAVTFVNELVCFATGTSGTDFSLDGGENWENLSKLGFHALQKAKTGKIILLTGSKGRVYKVTETK